MPELTLLLGQPVRITAVLSRGTERRPSTKPYGGTQSETWKVWRRSPLYYVGGGPRPHQDGIVVGIRTLQNGVVEYGGYEDPTTFQGKEAVQAVLVSWHLRRKPCLVHPDDLTVLPTWTQADLERSWR